MHGMPTWVSPVGVFVVAAVCVVLLGRVRVDRSRPRGVLRRARRLNAVRVLIVALLSDHDQVVLQEDLDRTLRALIVALELDHDLALGLAAPTSSVRVEVAAEDALVRHPAVQLKEGGVDAEVEDFLVVVDVENDRIVENQEICGSGVGN